MISEHKDIRAHIGIQTGEYAKACLIGQEDSLEMILEFTEPQAEDQALDVATGAGFTAAALAPLVEQVVACDLTEEILESAEALFLEKGLTNIMTDVVDIESLPYSDGVFDIVTSCVGGHHFEHVRRAVSEMGRVLKPGGRFVAIDTASPADKKVDEFLNLLEKMRDPAHIRNYNEPEWRSVVAGAGLEVVEVRSGSFEVDFDVWAEEAELPDKMKKMVRNRLLSISPDMWKTIGVREKDGRVTFKNFWLCVYARKAAG